MKCSVDGVWVHIPCVAWNPQLLFKDIEALCPAEIRPILRQPQLNVCKYCGKRKGVPIKCHCANCINYYHATCAQDAGCILDAEAEGEGVVFTMYDSRTNLSLEVVENVKEHLNENIYKTIIPRNVRLAEAPSYGMPINLYDSRSSGAESYRLLAAEVISRGEEL